MKKRTTLFSLFLLVILAAAAVYINRQDSYSTFDGDDQNFAVRDTQNITKVFLADREGNRILIERQNAGNWILNNEYEARQSAVNVLLETIRELKVYSPVSKSKYENVLKKIAQSGIKVEIYKDGSKPVKTYYVGAANMDHTGNYMLIDGASKPYVVHIEGFHGYLSPRFFTREEDWRVKRIWNYSFGEIDEVELVYPSEPEKSFLVKQQQPGIFGLYDGEGNEVAPYDTASVLSYIAMFKDVNFESFEVTKTPEQHDSIAAQTPKTIYKVTDRSGRVRKVETHKKIMQDKFDPETGEPIEVDLDRMYGIIDDELTVIVQYYVFDPLTAELQEFAPLNNSL